MNRSTLAMAVSMALAVTACGGGGGGPGAGPSATMPLRPDAPAATVPFHTPLRVGTHQSLTGTGTQIAVSDIFVRDLNADRIDEVVVGGRMTQSNVNAAHRDSLLQIYGWNNNPRAMTNETATWFRSGENQIQGTEPSVKFGDFNGDGRIDMLVAPSSDNSNRSGSTYVYLNQGNNRLHRATVPLPETWSHDSVVRDFNGDGIDDFMITDYKGRFSVAFGSRTNTWTTYSTTVGAWASSSVTAGDFLGDGRTLLIKGDSGTGTGNGGQDVGLYSWSVATGNLELTKISVLPRSRFYQAKWQGIVDPTTSHELRVMSMDFDRDGRMDVIVVSSAGAGQRAVSEIQFLKNKGSGTFEDVTDTVLKGYDTNTLASYQPIIVDFNGDGLPDILLGSADKNSNRVLIQTREGVFVDSHSDVFRQFYQQSADMTANIQTCCLVPINIVTGPDNKRYLMTGINFTENGETRQAMYLSLIGTTGTVTAQATVASLKQMWPYLSPAEANSVLAANSYRDFAGYDPTLHGNGVLDWSRVFQPIGGLGLSLDGRTGKRQPIAGTIAVPGFDNRLLKDVSALDALARDFTVDLRGLAGRPMPALIQHSQIDRAGSSWASRFLGLPVVERQGFWAAEDNLNWTTGASTRALGWDRPYVLGVSATRMQGSPWFGFTGVFGSVQTSTIMDTTIMRHWSNGAWLQAGVMQTATTFTPGLVTKVEPVWSGYAIAGWQTRAWSLQAGIQPTVFAGNMTLRLPERVDESGLMHYRDHRVGIRQDPVAFAGAERRWHYGVQTLSLHAVANTDDRYLVQARYRLAF